jgi:hypothetical protein
VYVGGVLAGVTSATNNTLKVVVPKGASYGPVHVILPAYGNGFNASSSTYFTPSFEGNGLAATSYGAQRDFAHLSSPVMAVCADVNNGRA